VIVVVATGIGVASALWSWPRIKRLASVRLRHIELVWVALVVQLMLFEWFARRIPMGVTEAVHYLTYALTVAFIVLNRHVPGAWLIALGTACNLAAIVANGGSMPASMSAWERAGLRPIPPEVFENSSALSDPNLGFLGDIFAVPASWPLSNVFSIGDVLIVIGGTYLAHQCCRRRPAAEPEGTLNTTESLGAGELERAVP
jgi:hypothetical protein